MAVEAARPNIFIRARNFYHDVVAELKRVTWPDRMQIRSGTIGIIIFILIVGLIITFMDTLLQLVLVRLIPSLFT